MSTAVVVAAHAASDPLVARFEAFYAACHLRVLGLLRQGLARRWSSHVGGWDESGGGAEPAELAQETWLRLWRRWPELAAALAAGQLDDQMLASYALTTAHHVLVDQQRQRQVRQRVGERTLSAEGWEATETLTPDLSHEGQPEARTLAVEALHETLAVARRLSQREPGSPGRPAETHGQLDILLSAMATGASMEAAAAQLGISVGAVKMRMLHLRQVLRAWRAAEAEEAAQEAAGERP